MQVGGLGRAPKVLPFKPELATPFKPVAPSVFKRKKGHLGAVHPIPTVTL